MSEEDAKLRGTGNFCHRRTLEAAIARSASASRHYWGASGDEQAHSSHLPMLNTSEKASGLDFYASRSSQTKDELLPFARNAEAQGGKGVSILERVAESVGGSAAREAVRDNLARGR